jgi:hypothetical protein
VNAGDPDRALVRTGTLRALSGLARAIWGEGRMTIDEIPVRLMVGLGDIARAARDTCTDPTAGEVMEARLVPEVKKELGNLIFSTIRFCDDLGFDVEECLELAIKAQRKFANSGRKR